MSALKITFKLGAFPLKGSAGIGKEAFVLSGDSW